MDFKSKRWSSFQSNHSLGFPRLHYHLQKPSLLPDLLLYTRWTIRIYLHLGGFFSISKTFFLFYQQLLHFFLLLKHYGLPNQVLQVLKETSPGHEVWLRHRYEGKIQNLPYCATFTRWIMCLFRLTIKIVGGDSGTEYLCTQPRYLRNRNASLGKII